MNDVQIIYKIAGKPDFSMHSLHYSNGECLNEEAIIDKYLLI